MTRNNLPLPFGARVGVRGSGYGRISGSPLNPLTPTLSPKGRGKKDEATP